MRVRFWMLSTTRPRAIQEMPPIRQEVWTQLGSLFVAPDRIFGNDRWQMSEKKVDNLVLEGPSTVFCRR